MKDNKAHAEPSDVAAEAGEVIVEGPDGVAVSLTPEAAYETSARLKRSANKATEQREKAGRAKLSHEPQ